MRFYVYVGAEQVASFEVDELDEFADPVAVSLDAEFKAGERNCIAGFDITGARTVTVGHWPDGEEWTPLAVINPEEVPLAR